MTERPELHVVSDVEAAEIKQKKEELAELIKEKQKELRLLELH